jgi:hypothetical protein
MCSRIPPQEEVDLMRYLSVVGSMLLNGGGTNLVTYMLGAKYFIIVNRASPGCGPCFNYPLQRALSLKSKKIVIYELS